MITWERMYQIAKDKAIEWKKEYNRMLKHWEDAVAELKYYKKLVKKAKIDLNIKDTEIRSLKVENDLLKKNLLDALELLDKRVALKDKNLYKSVKDKLEYDVTNTYIEKDIEESEKIEKPKKKKTSFDIKLSDLSKSLREVRRLDVRV